MLYNAVVLYLFVISDTYVHYTWTLKTRYAATFLHSEVIVFVHWLHYLTAS